MDERGSRLLGLLVNSSKSQFDAMGARLVQFGANVIMLDTALADDGPDAKPAREELRQTVEVTLRRIWSEERSTGSTLAAIEQGGGIAPCGPRCAAQADDPRAAHAAALLELRSLRPPQLDRVSDARGERLLDGGSDLPRARDELAARWPDEDLERPAAKGAGDHRTVGSRD